MLYLDIDDTLLSWASGEPKAVPAAGAFVQWAMERFEVRWLTRWCPSGEMPDDLLGDLAKMLRVEASELRPISACDWGDSGIKANGIAWLEHIILGREFLWIEDPEGLTELDHEVLRSAGYTDRYIPCNVTKYEDALDRVRRRLDDIGPRDRLTA